MDAQLPETGSGREVKSSVQHNVLRRKLYFKGIPAPVGAAYALTPMMLRLSNFPGVLGKVGEQGAWAVGRRGCFITLMVTAVMMVSPLPTLSSKMLRTDKRYSHLRSRFGLWAGALKGAAFALFAFTAWRYPFEAYLAFNVVHLASLPLGAVLYFNHAPPEPPRRPSALGSFAY